MSLDLAQCTDGELAALAVAGTQRAYTVLMQRHREPIYRLVRSHVGDADEALDVTQQSFVAAFTALKRYDSSRPFRVWLSRIAINKCHDWGRRRAVRRFFSFAAPIDEAQQVADDSVPADAAISGSQELRAAMRAIASLPANLKEPLILHAIENLSQAETAQALGISEKAVETRVYRARLKLAELLRG
ncbi:MAG: RNA polymerase sigma factor [Sphingomicrobium sp.]